VIVCVNMAPQQIIGVILFALIVGYSRGGDVDCSHSTNCATDTYSAVINCNKNLGNTEATNVCECDDHGVGDTCAKIVDFGTAPFNDVNFEKCKSWCTNLEDGSAPDLNCKFWKFTHTAFNTKCFLMDKIGCQNTDDDEECDNTPTHGDVNFPHCKSEAMDRDPTCTEDSKPTPPPGPCLGPIISGESDTTKFYQKWKCFQQKGGELDTIDMYEESSMPVGGYCKLDTEFGSCKSLDKTYRYNCDEEGSWVPDNEEDDGYDSTKKKLKDLECHAGDLTGVLDEDGREIDCVNGGLDGETIPSENSCLMTCDGYAVLSLFTDWIPGGNGRSWFYKISGSDSGKQQLDNGAIVKCWGRR